MNASTADAADADVQDIDVFISYSQKDRPIAEVVEKWLVALGFKVWRDQRLLDEPNQDFVTQIDTAHRAAKRVLVLWSPHSVASRWVVAEAEGAANEKKFVPLAIAPFQELRIAVPYRIFPTASIEQIRADRELLRRMVTPKPDILADLKTIPGLRYPERHHPPRLNTKGLPATYTGKLYGRDTELAQLFADLDDEKVHVVAYDAMGGTGKTALIYHLVQRLKEDGWHKLESVFIWSFYSQGSSEDKQTHAADFFKAAFAHFHPEGKAAKLPDDLREQGAQLADLIALQPTLLILDGLEPLQYAAAGGHRDEVRHYGGIKDPGVQTLLKQLADRGLGLTIVTTRIKVHELDGNTSFRSRPLVQLPTDAAIDLLRDRGIEAKNFPREQFPALPGSVHKEFVDAIEDLENHALSLNLAATFVATHQGGQIKAFADLPLLPTDEQIDPNHRSPFRVIQALETSFYRDLQERLETDGPSKALTSPPATRLALLYFLGLFDQPASLELLPVVYNSTQALRDAKPRGDKEEYLTKIRAAAQKRDETLAQPNLRDAQRKAAEREAQEVYHQASMEYWLNAIFATFDPKTEGNQRVLNALGQLNEQGLVSKARLVEAEDGHAQWEDLPPEKWFDHHVDCHPLIREYFGHQLRTRYEVAFRAAHGRLYDWFRFAGLPEEFRDPVRYGILAFCAAYPDFRDRFMASIETGKTPDGWDNVLPPSVRAASPEELKNSFRILPSHFRLPERFLPATEAAMTSLFAAIGHGCLAGRHDECFREVYIPRIARGNEKFATQKLGLFGQDLAALASFFESPFRTPHPGLQASDQALVLAMAGFALRAIGRLPDALEPMRAAAELPIATAEWERAASGHGNLSELLLTLGHLERDEAGQPGALPTAARAVEFADQSGDRFTKLVARTQVGDAAFRTGRLREAEQSFKEAETLEGSRMISLRGFLYGDLLLARGRAREVVERVQYSLPKHRQQNWLLDIGLDELNQARAQALLGTKNQEASTKNNPSFLNSLLNASTEDHIPRSYLAQAEILLISEGGLRTAEIEAALTEAETRARRGPMPLFFAEAWLLRSRLAIIGSRLLVAKDCRNEAAALIKKHGYGRRVPDLAVLDAEIDPCLETFQTACAKVNAEGWWHLMPRLQALAESRPKGFIGGGERGKWLGLLEPLREAERAYHAERDAYLKKVEKEAPAPKSSPGSTNPDLGAIADVLLAQLSPEIIQQIATQTGAPADWHQWPAELKAAVAQAIMEAQEGEG